MNKKFGLWLGMAAMALTMAFPRPVAADNTETKVPYQLGSVVRKTAIHENTLYTFSIPKSGTLTVKMGFYEGSGYSWGWHGGVTLYNSDGIKIGDRIDVRDNSGDTDYGIGTFDIVGGDYYLLAEVCDTNAEKSFELSTSFINSNETVPDTVHGRHNSDSSAIALPFNKKYIGHLAQNGDMDVYKFTLSKGKVVTFALNNSTNGVRYALVNSNNTVNFDGALREVQGSIKCFCPPGTYYLSISRWDKYGVYDVIVKTADLPKTTIKKVSQKKHYTTQWNYYKRKYVKSLYYSDLKVKYNVASDEFIKGYQIQFSKNKNFKKGNKSEFFYNDLKSLREINMQKKTGTYYVRMRGYAIDNRDNKYYAPWSSVKKITLKK